MYNCAHVNVLLVCVCVCVVPYLYQPPWTLLLQNTGLAIVRVIFRMHKQRPASVPNTTSLSGH